MKQLKVLMLEDNENDVELIQNELRSSLEYEVIFKWVISKSDFISALDEFQPDIILSDYNLPQLTGFHALSIAVEKCPLVPFIIVTGSLSEETAASSILRGAWDYVVKERLNRLPRAIENSLKLKNEKEKLFKAEEEIKLIKKQSGVQIKLLYDAINHAPSSIVIVDNAGNILYVNPKFTEITGYKSEEVVGKNAQLIKEGKQSDKILDNVWTNIKNGKEWTGELRNKRKNGELYWASVNISPIRDENDNITNYTIIEHDISDIVENELRLQNSENMYRALFDNTGTATCIIEDDDTISLANPKFEELCGFAKSELEGKMKWREFIAEEDLERITKYRKEKRESGKTDTSHCEFLFKDRKGNIKNILLSVDRIKNADRDIASHLDITDQKKIKDTLEAEHILLRTVIDNLPDAIYVKDKKFRKILLNKADLQNIGKEEHEVIGKSDYDLFPPETAAKTTKDDEYVINTGNSIINREEFLVSSDGREIWLLTSKLPLYDEAGKIRGLVGIGHDITESKRMVEELIEAKEKAEEMNRLKSIFLANMSHELRTPLVGLLGFSEALQNDLTGEQKKYAEYIYQGGERLLRTLSTLLNYSKIEAEKTKVYFLNIPLVALLKDEIKFYSAMAKNKGLIISTDFAVNELDIISDEKLLREIIDNLLSNAVKFTNKGSIKITLIKENKMAVVSIKDTGIGISKGNIELIFEEFRQVSEGDNRNFQGTGLGLTLTKKYLNLLNGKIEVESEVNVGTTFTIRLPLGNQSGNSEESLAIKNGKKSNELLAPDIIKQKKVLLVEDERINQLTIKKMLDSNFLVDCVNNSDEAINAVLTNNYDVILLDVNLGEGRNGIEIAKEIKKISDYNEKPIIAMTAYAMDKDKEEFLSSGFTHYIAKPFKRKELLDLLAKV